MVYGAFWLLAILLLKFCQCFLLENTMEKANFVID